ncbi:phosphatase PAP2 family protein [Kaarinaea lacus]
MIHFNCKPGLSRILIVIVFYTFSNYAVANDEDLENFGDAMQYVLPLTAWGATFIYDDKDGRIQFYKHGITAFSITTVGKWVFDKTRPNASSSTTSFPSGHTTGAFIGATFLGKRYGPWWGVPAYTAAFITAYSRVDADAHHVDDVIAGASVAYFSSLYWVTPHESNIWLTPTASEDSVGVAVTVTDKKPKVEDLDLYKGRKYRYSLGFGPAYMQKNQFKSPTDTGDTFDLENFEGTTDPHTTAVPMFEWFINEKNTLALSLAPYEARDFGYFSQPTNFGGVTFPANTQLRSAYRMNEFRLAYDYKFYKTYDWILKAGAAVIWSYTELELGTTEGPAVYAEVEDSILLPLLYAGVNYNLNRKWSLYADLYGISISTDKQMDGGLGVTYQFNRHWDASIGYAYYERDIETSTLTNHAQYDILAFNVGYTYY